MPTALRRSVVRPMDAALGSTPRRGRRCSSGQEENQQPMRTQPVKQQSRKRDPDERSGMESAQTCARPNNGVVHDGAATPIDTVAAIWVNLSALHPWPNNPTKDDPASVRRVAESIKRFGFGAPLVARAENGEIIAGHTRFKAAQLLK